MTRHLRAGLLALVSVALASPAAARSPADQARAWGLLGSWSLDCSLPPARTNNYLSYLEGGSGAVIHRREFGDTADENIVNRLRVISPAEIEVVIEFKTVGALHTRRFILFKAGDGRIRAVENQLVGTQEFSIRDGKFTANGQLTPWQTKCR